MWWALAAVLLAAPEPDSQVQAALALEQAGRDAEALSALDALLAQEPRYVPALLERARLHLKSGQALDAAQADLDAAAKLASETPRLHYLRASLFEERGQTWDAVRAIEEALRLRPEYAEARFRAAGLALSMGDLYKAELHYRVLAQQDPNALAPRLQLATVLEKQARDADAEAVLVEALARHPDSTAARRLAELYERTGRPKLAAQLRTPADAPAAKPMRKLRRSRR
jgi:tetratricopeptide (TPR) repeat protein